MKNLQEDIADDLSFLHDTDDAFIQEFFQNAQVIELPAGTTICWEGDTCRQLAIIISGTVRVFKLGENGREITLYRLERAQSCILTASCILSQVSFPAIAQSETDIEAIVIPASIVRDWMDQYYAWREYVFRLLSQRFSDIIATVEEVAFRRMDTRIAEYLIGLSGTEELIKITHQRIAYDLGTAREVVSRVLKDFENSGLISLSRGTVVIQDMNRLLNRARDY